MILTLSLTFGFVFVIILISFLSKPISAREMAHIWSKFLFKAKYGNYTISIENKFIDVKYNHYERSDLSRYLYEKCTGRTSYNRAFAYSKVPLLYFRSRKAVRSREYFVIVDHNGKIGMMN